MAIKTLILSGYGINSEAELKQCFIEAGSTVDIIHINEMIANPSRLSSFDLLAFPGGFSFGDHISSGKIFANKIKIYLEKYLNLFIEEGKPVLGICNGFQMLVKGGWLPNTNDSLKNREQQVTLMTNDRGKFENRWVNLNVETKNSSFWLKGIERIDLPVRHGEGNFVTKSPIILEEIQKNNQIAFYYADDLGENTMAYPYNPNGSILSIAGITNKKGNVLGLMPHPECYRIKEHHPNLEAWADSSFFAEKKKKKWEYSYFIMRLIMLEKIDLLQNKN